MGRFFLLLMIGELLESTVAFVLSFQGDKLLFLASEEASYMGEISQIIRPNSDASPTRNNASIISFYPHH